MNSKILVMVSMFAAVFVVQADVKDENPTATFDKAEKAYAMNGQPSKNGGTGNSWRRECVKWCKTQKLAQMEGAQKFVDSTGGEHKLGVGVMALDGLSMVKRRMAKNQTQLSAMKYLMLATSPNVQYAQTNTVSNSSSHKAVSYTGTLNSYQVLFTSEVQEGEKRYCIVVVGE